MDLIEERKLSHKPPQLLPLESMESNAIFDALEKRQQDG